MREIKYCPPKKNGGKDSGADLEKPTTEIILPPPTNATNVMRCPGKTARAGNRTNTLT